MMPSVKAAGASQRIFPHTLASDASRQANSGAIPASKMTGAISGAKTLLK